MPHVYTGAPHLAQGRISQYTLILMQIERQRNKYREIDIHIDTYAHVCFAIYQLRCLCFLPQKKQRTKDLSGVFHSYSPYDHKVRDACDYVIGKLGGREVFLNVWHNVPWYAVILKYTYQFHFYSYLNFQLCVFKRNQKIRILNRNNCILFTLKSSYILSLKSQRVQRQVWGFFVWFVVFLFIFFSSYQTM